MKKSIRILGMTLIMTIMAIIMAASVFAETTTYNVWPNTTDSYVTQSASSAYEVSGKVTVYLSLHSKKVNGASLDKHYTVTVGDTNTPSRVVTVRDILLKAMENDTDLSFLDYGGDEITNTSTGFYKVQYGTGEDAVIYAPTALGERNGWMFRVNKKFVLLSGTPGTISAYGAAINTSYVTSGTIVDFFMDNVDSESTACNFPRVQNVKYDPSTNKLVSVRVDASKDWYEYDEDELDYIWNITPFSNLSGATVKLYGPNNTFITSAVTNNQGVATFNETLSNSTSYRIEIAQTYNGVYYDNMHSQIHWIVNSTGGGTWKRY